MSKIVVETRELMKTYRRGKIDIPALRGINIRIYHGDIACLIGPSGSGKTTILNLISGLDKPTSGKIFVDGLDITTLNGKQLADFRLTKIGFIFQFYNLIPTLTALENVEIPMAFAGVPKNKRKLRAAELLKMVGLEQRIDHKPDELSGGEQQRVAIARALANKPAIILADEPTGDLDSATAIMFMKLVKELNGKADQTFVIVTHDPLVAYECTVAYTIRDGLIERVLSKDQIPEAFPKIDISRHRR
jgi:putative ABC transport system ATP-binding protein